MLSTALSVGFEANAIEWILLILSFYLPSLLVTDMSWWSMHLGAKCAPTAPRALVEGESMNYLIRLGRLRLVAVVSTVSKQSTFRVGRGYVPIS